MALLSASGGGAAWMADMCTAHGLELPEMNAATRKEIDPLIPSFASSQNPIDLTAQAIREVGYARIIEILQRSPVTDMILVVGSLATETMLRRDHHAGSAGQRGAHRLLRLHQRVARGHHPSGQRRDSRVHGELRQGPARAGRVRGVSAAGSSGAATT